MQYSHFNVFTVSGHIGSGPGAILLLSCLECIQTRGLHLNHSIDNIIVNWIPFARTVPNGYSVCRPGLQLSGPVLPNRTRRLHCSGSVVRSDGHECPAPVPAEFP